MLSSFVSREFRYGFELSDDQLKQINDERRGEAHEYSDTSAGKSINGKTWKPLLTHSPFVSELEYGMNNEGYWTYD